MSANSSVKIWYMQPGLEHYRPGMEMGKPHAIVEATSIIRAEELKENMLQRERIKRGNKTKRKGGAT